MFSKYSVIFDYPNYNNIELIDTIKIPPNVWWRSGLTKVSTANAYEKCSRETPLQSEKIIADIHICYTHGRYNMQVVVFVVAIINNSI